MSSLPTNLKDIILRALNEDIGFFDVTTQYLVGEEKRASAKIIVKQDRVIVAGGEVAKAVFLELDKSLEISINTRDGKEAARGAEIIEIKGRASSILQGERVALNFLGHLCGIATKTRTYVQKLEGLNVQLLDTRKTTPGLRALEKYAVRVGGGRNHRLSLSDGILIKENHIRAAGNITAALKIIKSKAAPGLKIEIETTNLREVEEALENGAEIIMLDNMNISEMKKAVKIAKNRALLEASGNITLDNVREVAETGVDFISSGSITHSAPSADLSLLFAFEK